MSVGKGKRLASVQRCTALPVARSFRTVSHEAVSVIPPMHLQAKERAEVFGGTNQTVAKSTLMTSWKNDWSTAENRRWTFRMIGDVGQFMNSAHADIHFCLS